MPSRSEQELVALFSQLGVDDPASWAQSEIQEGLPQLLRALFLKQAWERITPDGDTSWIGQEMDAAMAYPDGPYAGLGPALARCLGKGVAPEDLTEIARCLQAQTLFSIACLMDGPQWSLPGLPDLSWGLFETDAQGLPVGPQVAGLHESVLAFDPTGREMRPLG